jgi:hypothetical protein
MKKVVTIKEYDNEGKLITETITETYDDIVYPTTVPYYPSYPVYPYRPYYVTVTV